MYIDHSTYDLLIKYIIYNKQLKNQTGDGTVHFEFDDNHKLPVPSRQIY